MKTGCFITSSQAQYKFIHDAILEAISFPDTETSSGDIRVKAARLKETLPGTTKTKGKEVFEVLDSIRACILDVGRNHGHN